MKEHPRNPGEGILGIRERFRDPPSWCRPRLQWSWNGPLSEERIDEILEQCRERGFGGFFAHIRPGLPIPYLGDEWFRLWEYAARRCAELGLEWNIYDEYTVGGGAGGGHTVARLPLAVQRELAVQPVVSTAQAIPAIAWFVLEVDREAVWEIACDEVGAALGEGRRVLALVHQIAPGSARRNALGPVDLYHPDAVRAFIESTHERYAAASGDLFGSTVRFCFNDEPHTTESRTSYPYSHLIAREFQRDHDYRLDEKLESLLFWEHDSHAVRYDFYRTLNRLYCRGYVRPLHDWCADHGLGYTGHFLEHLWPRPIGQPNVMAAYRWMQAPGIDLLGIRFSTESVHANAQHILNLKELASVANQFEKADVMVESSGAGGWHRAFDLFKPCEDLLLAFGVTVMDPHLAHTSIAGARKYDYAQTLSDHVSWWDHYRIQADHVARVIAVQHGGREENRVLVLHPTTTAWMYHQPQGYPWEGSANGRRLELMEQRHPSLLVDLYGDRIDFDLGDETLLEESGRVDGHHFRVGAARYAVVVIPPDFETISWKNLLLLEKWLETGGRVLEVGASLVCVDARQSDQPGKLRARYRDCWEILGSEEALRERLIELVPPRLAPVGVPSADDRRLIWRRSLLVDGTEVLFLANPWDRSLSTGVRLPSEGSLSEWDTATGGVHQIQVEAVDGVRGLEIGLPPRGHRLIVRSPAGVGGPAPRWRSSGEPREVALQRVGRQSENLLLVDYCDMAVPGRRLRDVSTVLADQRNWEWQGFSRSPWLMTAGITPFDGDIDRVTIPDDSGLSIGYRFIVADGLEEPELQALSLAVERPWLYRIEVNGHPVESEGTAKWLDCDMRRLPVGRLLRFGMNEVVLRRDRFHLLCEVAPIYVLGSFALRAAERGFHIDAPREPELGDWTRQGCPFYDGIVTYRFSVDLDRPDERIEVELGRWSGSVVEVAWNGTPAGVIVHPPFCCDLPAGGEGSKGILELRVHGNPRNKMGPHFSRSSRHTVAAWLECPATMPPGEQYRFVPSGLWENPEVRPIKRVRQDAGEGHQATMAAAGRQDA